MIKYLWCKTFYKLHPYPLNTLVKTWLLFFTFKANRHGGKFRIFDIGDPASPSSCGLSLPLSCDLPPVVGQPPPRQQPPLNQQQNQVTGKIVLRKLVMGNLTSFHSCKEEILTSIRGREESEWWMVEFKVFKGGLEHLRQLSRSKVNVVCGYVRWQRPTAPPTNDNKY